MRYGCLSDLGRNRFGLAFLPSNPLPKSSDYGKGIPIRLEPGLGSGWTSWGSSQNPKIACQNFRRNFFDPLQIDQILMLGGKSWFTIQ